MGLLLPLFALIVLALLSVRWIDLVPTVASLLGTASLVKTQGSSGAALAQVKAVYQDAAGLWQLAKADTTVHAGVGSRVGITLTGCAAINQDVVVALLGDVNVGATLVVGTEYVISGAAAGGIAPAADLTTGQFLTKLGIATTATNLHLYPEILGIAVP